MIVTLCDSCAEKIDEDNKSLVYIDLCINNEHFFKLELCKECFKKLFNDIKKYRVVNNLTIKHVLK